MFQGLENAMWDVRLEQGGHRGRIIEQVCLGGGSGIALLR